MVAVSTPRQEATALGPTRLPPQPTHAASPRQLASLCNRLGKFAPLRYLAEQARQHKTLDPSFGISRNSDRSHAWS